MKADDLAPAMDMLNKLRTRSRKIGNLQAFLAKGVTVIEFRLKAASPKGMEEFVLNFDNEDIINSVNEAIYDALIREVEHTRARLEAIGVDLTPAPKDEAGDAVSPEGVLPRSVKQILADWDFSDEGDEL